MQSTIKTRAHVAMLLAACTTCLALSPPAHAATADESTEGGKVNVEVAKRVEFQIPPWLAPSGALIGRTRTNQWYQSTDGGQTWTKMG